MKLVDMKYSKKELADEAKEMLSPVGEPSEYPWGLQIRLEQEDLDKLGIDVPELDAELHLLAIAHVTSVSRETSGDKDVCVSLQIRMLAVADQGDADEERAEKETPASELAEMTPAAKDSLLALFGG